MSETTQTDTKTNAPIIGSRGSQLALWQANHVSAMLGEVEIKVIKTSGDRFQDIPLQGQADKGFFTKEIEQALLDGEIDLAVHSLKDLPTILPPGLTLGGVSARAAIADLLLVRPDKLDATRTIPVQSGSKIGATSLRRQALLRRFAPDLKPALLRGNVPTRIEKLRRGDYDAIIIAEAGIERLKLDISDLKVFALDPEIWLPAPGQAVLGVEIRKGDTKTAMALAACGLYSDHARREVGIERELLARFEGGCHAAFGAWARIGADGCEVFVGHEDDNGDWKAARARHAKDDIAMETAYDALKRILASGREEDAWTGTIAIAR